MIAGNNGSAAAAAVAAAGKACAENEASLTGDAGDVGVWKGSSRSVAEFKGAGTIRDALASAAMDAFVGPASGYLE